MSKKDLGDEILDATTTAPRIPWSIIAMGASVLVTLALNYASYDTRITVLERSLISLEERTTQLSAKNDELSYDVLRKDSRIIALERDIQNHMERVKRLEQQQDVNKKGR